MHIIVIVVILCIIGAAIQYWYVTLGLIGIGVGIYLYVSDQDKKKALQEKLERDQRAGQERRQREAQQAEKAAADIRNAHNRARHGRDSLITDIPRQANEYIARLSANLAEAQASFQGRAFSLFWSAAEQGYSEISQATRAQEWLQRCLNDYNRSAPSVSPPLQPLILDFSEFGGIQQLKLELQELVARAHRDYQFVMVYEARNKQAALEQAAEEIRVAEARRREEEDSD